jgi:hypothetical protein
MFPGISAVRFLPGKKRSVHFQEITVFPTGRDRKTKHTVQRLRSCSVSRTSTPSWYLRTLSICYCLFLRFSFGVLFRIPSNFEQRGQLHPPPTLAHFHHSNTPPPISRHPSSSLYDRSAVLPRTPLQSHVGLRIFN